MPPPKSRLLQLSSARSKRDAPPPPDVAIRSGPRRTSTPLEAAAAAEGLGEVEMQPPDSPTVDLTSDDSAEASTEEDEPVDVTATAHGSGSVDVQDCES